MFNKIKFNINTTFVIISSIIILSFIYKAFPLIPFDPVDGKGDSTGRIIHIIRCFPFDYSWVTSTIWLPFYFILYSIPLHLSFTYNSLIIFQVFISSLLSAIVFCSAPRTMSKFSQVLCILIISLMPLNTMLSRSLLSEISFILFVFISGYFFTKFDDNRKKSYYLYISIISLLIVSMLRYEGWILYISYIFFIFYKTKSVKYILIASFSFAACVYFVEQSLIEAGQGHFSGILDNYLETVPLIKKFGHAALFSKLKLIAKFHFQNSGLFFLLLPLAFWHALKRGIDIYLYFFIVLWLSLFFGTISDSVALFSRYWFPSLTLLIFLIVRSIDSLPKNIHLVVLPLTLMLQLFYAPYIHDLSREVPSNSAHNFLTNSRAKLVYIDELQSNYVFYAFKVHNLFSEYKYDVVHYNDNLSLIPDPMEFRKRLENDFLEKFQSNNFDHLVFFENSILYNHIQEKQIIQLEKNWRLVFRDKRVQIFERVNPTS